MHTTEYLIVGAGVAGLSTAYHLAEAGESSVEVLEKEDRIGAHASTKNSGMVHHFHPDREMRSHIDRGVQRLREYDRNKEADMFSPSPSLFLFSEERIDELENDPEPWGGRERVPTGDIPASLKPAHLPSGSVWVRFNRDGLIQPELLLRSFREDLTRSDIHVQLEEPIVNGERNGSEWIIETGKRTIQANHVVVAAGAWAESLGALLGAEEKGLNPYRRHLYVARENILPEEIGFFWDAIHDIYFRHYEGHTLMSNCDNHDVPPGETPDIDRPTRLMRESLATYFPQFADVTFDEYWSCHRTRGPERVPYIASDERPGLHWVAGLEGHGITASMWIGERARDVIMSTGQ